jgi:TELO2-interacting protein 1
MKQVIIDGVGIFNLCLGTDFISSGFLHSSLYFLLENLSSSNYQVRNAADSVLQILSTTSAYETVSLLVIMIHFLTFLAQLLTYTAYAFI